MYFKPTVFVIPRHISKVVASAIFVSLALFSTAGSIFPFSFSGKSVTICSKIASYSPFFCVLVRVVIYPPFNGIAWGKTCFYTPDIAIFHCIIPRYLTNRFIITFVVTGILSSYIKVFLLRYFMIADAEATYCYGMLWFCDPHIIASHLECTTINNYKTV